MQTESTLCEQQTTPNDPARFGLSQVEERVSHYEVIVSLEGELLYLRTMGAEYTTGAHFDEYIMEFSSFKDLEIDDEAPFVLPPECSQTPLERGVQPMALALAALAPDVRAAPQTIACALAAHLLHVPHLCMHNSDKYNRTDTLHASSCTVQSQPANACRFSLVAVDSAGTD